MKNLKVIKMLNNVSLCTLVQIPQCLFKIKNCKAAKLSNYKPHSHYCPITVSLYVLNETPVFLLHYVQ